MRHWSDSKLFQRIFEIIPGSSVWLVLLFPFLFTFFFPVAVAYFILIFNLYWFLKAFNIARHLVNGLHHMKYNMKTDWFERCQKVSKNLKSLTVELEKKYQSKSSFLGLSKRDLREEIKELENLHGRQELVKNYNDIVHLVVIPTYTESFEILDETLAYLVKANYPSKTMVPVVAGEERDEENFLKIKEMLAKKYDGVFKNLLFFVHRDKVGEVKGKGANMTSAGKKAMKYVESEGLDPENVLVTTLDADHIVQGEYFSRLTYKYIIDPDRDRKTYQPVALLFNNIWDAPAPNRVAAIASSFWVIVESMRPYRLRTFASHTQSLKTLLVTDFWSTQTIVEDGHQYFRTYFAFNGNIEMVPLLVPVYQDCVLDETIFKTFSSQYLQRRRWAWGASDLPFVVRNFIQHPEIAFREKAVQTFRQYISHLSWASSSLILASWWIPLLFNKQFMDSVIAHNVTRYSSNLALTAWAAIFFSVWAYLSLLPKRPKKYSKMKYIGMVTHWVFTPPVAILLSSIPSIDAQTRLMIGKRLEFFITPKIRKSKIMIDKK